MKQPASNLPPVMLARDAMATRFELALQGDNPLALRAAGEEVLDEIQRLEDQISPHRPGSEIARVNALAHDQAVRVSPPVFRLLAQARRLHRETGGNFDITVGPLLRCWGLQAGSPQVPAPAALAQARNQAGAQWIDLDENACTVRFRRPGMRLDLGGIGKGYAVEVAARLLREAGVDSALVHGGTSTVQAIGHPPGRQAWLVALELPPEWFDGFVAASAEEAAPAAVPAASPDRLANLVAVVPLRDEALSVSAVWGRSFEAGGRRYGHVLDPRTGEPAQRAVMAAVVLPSATESDALSTALLVGGPAEHAWLNGLRPGMRSLVVEPAGRWPRAHALGIPLQPAAGAAPPALEKNGRRH